MKASIVKNAAVCIFDCEDGSVLVEVIGDLFRFGISFDVEEKDTSWFFVSKPECELSKRSMFGHFEAEEV